MILKKINIKYSILYYKFHTIWLIRINKITTKDYNYVARVFKKIGFSPRRITPIIFIKALFYHTLQKKSWRSISELLNCNHIALHSFYSNYGNKKEIIKIFHYFAKAKVIVFIGENKTFTNDDLDNNDAFLKLTISELNYIFET
ncbi:MAG: hypothetical protein PHV23_06050 [Candidatus Gracilibacteria bacterium]|nr:hypothetical protein [Candidatus Gracilibacteria bacterium]